LQPHCRTAPSKPGPRAPATAFEFDLGVIANVRNDNSPDSYLELLMAGYNLDGTLN
jgi:hypothetical protein